MKNLNTFGLVTLLSLSIAGNVFAEGLDPLKDGIHASTLERCGLGLAMQKIKARGLQGDIKLKGEVNQHETNRGAVSVNWEQFEEQNKVGLIFIDFEGSVSETKIEGRIAIYAQKSQDKDGHLTSGVNCMMGAYNQLQYPSQRRFILKDKKNNFEID